MNKIIVADASPLIALGRIDKIHLLSKLFSTIIIPEVVAVECLTDKTKPGTTAIQQAIDNNLIQIHPNLPTSKYDDLVNILGKGEAAAITLAQTLKLPLIIDEKLGRNTARKLDIKIIGTSGILLLAKRKNIINSVKPILLSLKKENYYLFETFIKKILKLAKED